MLITIRKKYKTLIAFDHQTNGYDNNVFEQVHHTI